MTKQLIKNSAFTILCCVLFTVSGFSQKKKEAVVIPNLPVSGETGLYTYSGVVELPGTTKDQLYERAFSWANSFYKNPADVIREKSPEEGRLLIKARFKISNEADKKGTVTQAGDVMYSLTLGFKDGKYRYEITRINWQHTSYYAIERWNDVNSPSFNPAFAYYLKQTDEKINEVIASFKKQLAANPKSKPNDW